MRSSKNRSRVSRSEDAAVTGIPRPRRFPPVALALTVIAGSFLTLMFPAAARCFFCPMSDSLPPGESSLMQKSGQVEFRIIYAWFPDAAQGVRTLTAEQATEFPAEFGEFIERQSRSLYQPNASVITDPDNPTLAWVTAHDHLWYRTASSPS